MSREFLLPQLGEGLPEAELVRWLVDVGDEVALNQNIAEVETAKAVVELPSPYAGTVRTLHHVVGDVIEVGAPLITVDDGSEDAAPAAPPAVQSEASTPSTAPDEGEADAVEEPATATPNLVGYGVAPRSGARPQRRARVAHPHPERAEAEAALRAAAPHDVVPALDPEPRPERPRSTPPVRKLAKDLGVDLALVAASGVTGRITREDVEAYAARVAPSAPTAPAAADSSDDRTTRVPIRGVRRATAEAMVRSKFTAPHVSTFHTVDVTRTMKLVAALKDDRALADHHIGVMAVVAKAVCLALGANPSLNAAWDGDAGEIVLHHYVNLGIAAATERGLIVPVIRDADAMTLVEIADALAELTAAARSGRTAPTAMTGGTFSLTNYGVFGVEAGTPIINPGQAAILGLGAVAKRPWEHHGKPALRRTMTLSLSFDHRLVDGAEGARFLVDVARILERPGRAMLLR